MMKAFRVIATGILALVTPALVSHGYAKNPPTYANSAFDWEAKQSRSPNATRSPTSREMREDLTPEYPLTSRLRYEQGTVRVRISLDQRGGIAGMAIEHTSFFERLDEAAMKFLKTNWVYAPVPGAPMPASVPVDVTFRF
jgi:protein TonB